MKKYYKGGDISTCQIALNDINLYSYRLVETEKMLNYLGFFSDFEN